MSVKIADCIGKIAYAKLPYYNVKKGKMSFKGRPVLIINTELSSLPCDLTLLPISRVSNQKHLHAIYDVEVEEHLIPCLKLKFHPSYIRTHKTLTAHSKDVSITDLSLKEINVEFYKEIKEKHQRFNATSF